MELTWYGTAGFRIKTGGHTILIDPYLSRNEKAQPEQPLKPHDFHDGDLIFISHHQDNFFPPISTMVDLQPFVDGVRHAAPGTEVKVLEMNQTVTL